MSQRVKMLQIVKKVSQRQSLLGLGSFDVAIKVCNIKSLSKCQKFNLSCFHKKSKIQIMTSTSLKILSNLVYKDLDVL